MKTLIYTAAFVVACTTASFAQDTPASTTVTPADTSATREKVQEAVQDVKQDVKETAKEVKEDINRAADKAKVEIREEYNKVKSIQQRNQLSWFDRGSYMGSASLGLGTGAGSGTYLSISPRVGYFVQNGLMVGLRAGFDRRLGASYRANQVGPFIRYYPFRTRISAFGGFGYNFGREFSSNISADEKARFNSMNLEIGAMFRVTSNLGLEVALENNYYDQSDPLAGRNKGGRLRAGVNYFFGRVNR